MSEVAMLSRVLMRTNVLEPSFILLLILSIVSLIIVTHVTEGYVMPIED